jgi:hypothetical protein
MTQKAVGSLFLIAIVALLGIATSCSGPSQLQPGTPAFYWSAARETWAAGDYTKTAEHLESVMRTQNEFTAQAQAWHLVLTAGMAKGYIDLADYCDYGARAKPFLVTSFRRYASDFRTYANRLALAQATSFQEFQKTNKDPKVSLVFTYPMGSAMLSPQLQKLGEGVLPNASVVDDIRAQHLKTSVVLATCKAVGAADDTAKTQSLFRAGTVQVPRETFLLAMAEALHDDAQLFTPKKLDQPDRIKLFAAQALDTVKMLPESKETTALNTKIQKTLKLVSTKK